MENITEIKERTRHLLLCKKTITRFTSNNGHVNIKSAINKGKSFVFHITRKVIKCSRSGENNRYPCAFIQFRIDCYFRTVST